MCLRYHTWHEILSLQVNFRERATYIVHLRRKMTCNLRHPMPLRHSVSHMTWDMTHDMRYHTWHEISHMTWGFTHDIRYDTSHKVSHMTRDTTRHMRYDTSGHGGREDVWYPKSYPCAYKRGAWAHMMPLWATDSCIACTQSWHWLKKKRNLNSGACAIELPSSSYWWSIGMSAKVTEWRRRLLHCSRREGRHSQTSAMLGVAVCCSVLQCVAACCSVQAPVALLKTVVCRD